MPAKRAKTDQKAKRPGGKRGANGRSGSVSEAMAASLAELLDDDTLDPEFDYYLAHLAEWYDHEGEHVLIHGQEHFGFFATRNAALDEGFRRFGRVPFLVKQVNPKESSKPELTIKSKAPMPAKIVPKKKTAKQPSSKRVANGRGGSVAKVMTSSLPEVTGDTTLDREVEYYLAHLPEWYDQEGEHVLIYGSEHFGFFATRNAALEEGFRRFGWVPFLVKQVHRDEKPIQLGWVIL